MVIAIAIAVDSIAEGAEVRINAQGQQRRVYCWHATPEEILRPLPGRARYVRPELGRSGAGADGAGPE